MVVFGFAIAVVLIIVLAIGLTVARAVNKTTTTKH